MYGRWSVAEHHCNDRCLHTHKPRYNNTKSIERDKSTAAFSSIAQGTACNFLVEKEATLCARFFLPTHSHTWPLIENVTRKQHEAVNSVIKSSLFMQLVLLMFELIVKVCDSVHELCFVL